MERTVRSKRPHAADASTEFHRKLAEAFLEQENDICDLLTMANITNNLNSEEAAPPDIIA
jgi:hypothetical protein